MCLPLGDAVAVADLGPTSLRRLRAAPRGCVEWSDDGARVRRLLTPAARVRLVVVRAATWRRGLLRASAFEPFATRVVLLPRAPGRLHEITWEADAAGVGLWSSETGTADGPGAPVTEIVAPVPFVCRYVKPAGWRFRERAFAAWSVTSCSQDCSGGVSTGGGVVGPAARYR
jgi:hypothetical protein